jgi:ABC-type nickel/cobalt efflux system permease component RcnA
VSPLRLTALSSILTHTVPISVLVITIALLLAFSNLVRALLSFAFNVSWAWIITYTPAYVSWRGTRMNSKTLRESEKKQISEMKASALKKKQKDMEAEKLRKEKLQVLATNPTSLRGQVLVHSNGDIEMGGVP